MKAPEHTRRLWLVTQYTAIPLLLLMVFGGSAVLPAQPNSGTQAIMAAIGIVCLIVLVIASAILANRTYKQMREGLQEQKRFVADASHDLRTPTTALRTLLEVSSRDPELQSPAFQNVLARSLRQVELIQGLTDGLLELASYAQRKPHLGLIKTDSFIREAINNLQPFAQTKSITIEYASINFKIRGDTRELTRLLSILLDNSIKYSKPNTSIQITAIKTRNKVRVAVMDEGVGILEEDLPYVFHRFYRGEKARSHQSMAGFGLGLAIAQEIATLHKGTLRVVSSIGVGSTFTVELPLA